MGCDYYRDTYLYVLYTNILFTSDIERLEVNYEDNYYDHYGKFDGSESHMIKINIYHECVYCHCSTHIDPLLDDQNFTCNCVIYSEELLPRDKYSKLYTILEIGDHNPITSIQRVITTNKRYITLL